MRETKDHVKTSIVLKDNVLKLVLTEANHLYVEAQDGWMYRGRRLHLTAHAVFNGSEWVPQSSLGSDAVYCPDASYAGHKAIAQALFLALNTVLINVEWFTKLRAEAEAVNANNEIERAERQIKELEEKLFHLKSKVTSMELTESLALMGSFPQAYEVRP